MLLRAKYTSVSKLEVIFKFNYFDLSMTTGPTLTVALFSHPYMSHDVLSTQFINHGWLKYRNIQKWSECRPFPPNHSFLVVKNKLDPQLLMSQGYSSYLCNHSHYHVFSFSAPFSTSLCTFSTSLCTSSASEMVLERYLLLSIKKIHRKHFLLMNTLVVVMKLLY